MKIGIVGVGNIGGAVAKIFAKAGHSIILSWSRNPEKLQQLAAELSQYQSVEVGTPAEAVQKADVVVLSAKFAIMDDMRNQMGDVTGKIIIDTNNQYDIVLPDGKSAAQEVQERFEGATIVKAFNTLYFEFLLSKGFASPRFIIPISADDEAAKAIVSKLIEEVGFDVYDLGGLENVFAQEVTGPLYNKLLTREQADTLLNA